MRIGLVSVHDPRHGEWEGRLQPRHRVVQATGAEVVYFSPIPALPALPIRRVKKAIYKHVLSRGQYHPEKDRIVCRLRSWEVDRRLRRDPVDVILSLTSPGSQPIAYLGGRVPVVVWSDSNFAGTLDYHEVFRRDRMCRESVRDGMANEARAFARAQRLLFMSEWACSSGRSEYPEQAHKVAKLELGPNVFPDWDEAAAHRAIHLRSHDAVRLLFVGSRWEAKGGPLALEATRILRDRGVNARLVVVGCNPPGVPPDWVESRGFLNLRKPEGQQRYLKELARSNLMIVPTREEAYGICFAEAAASALPSIAPRTGGVPDAVIDGVSGRLVDHDASPAMWANMVQQCLDPSRYHPLAYSTFKHHLEKRSDAVLAERLRAYLEQAIGSSR